MKNKEKDIKDEDINYLSEELFLCLSKRHTKFYKSNYSKNTNPEIIITIDIESISIYIMSLSILYENMGLNKESINRLIDKMYSRSKEMLSLYFKKEEEKNQFN
jgi:hypothetical protein